MRRHRKRPSAAGRIARSADRARLLVTNLGSAQRRGTCDRGNKARRDPAWCEGEPIECGDPSIGAISPRRRRFGESQDQRKHRIDLVFQFGAEPDVLRFVVVDLMIDLGVRSPSATARRWRRSFTAVRGRNGVAGRVRDTRRATSCRRSRRRPRRRADRFRRPIRRWHPDLIRRQGFAAARARSSRAPRPPGAGSRRVCRLQPRADCTAPLNCAPR
jgi:hypothetical protein